LRTYQRLAVRLKNADRDQLKGMLSGGVQPVRTLLRAPALQQLDQGRSAGEVAALVPLTSKAVREIGRRYEMSGLDEALYDKQRPGAATLLEPAERKRIIAMVCSDPPAGRARWTVRLVAAPENTDAGSRLRVQFQPSATRIEIMAKAAGERLYVGLVWKSIRVWVPSGR
jgi:hypothetical protein